MLPVHPNINRFLGEFISAVPDSMFLALPPLLQELGACPCGTFGGLTRLPGTAWPWCATWPCLLGPCVRGRSLAGTSVNEITGESRRRKAQFYLVEYFPMNLQVAMRTRFPRQTPPYSWTVAVLSDVCTAFLVLCRSPLHRVCCFWRCCYCCCCSRRLSLLRTPLPPTPPLHQVAQALLLLFSHQYLHLDLKRDNVVVREGASPSEPPHAVVRAWRWAVVPWRLPPLPCEFAFSCGWCMWH
jgi:hypothetical protein